MKKYPWIVVMVLLWGAFANAEGVSLEPVTFGSQQSVEWLNSRTSECWMRRTVIATEDPVKATASQVIYDEYVPRSVWNAVALPLAPSVFILPPTGGETFLDRAYARSLCSRGIVGVLIKHWTHDIEAGLDLDTHDRGFARAMVAIRRVLHWVKTERPQGRLGILGTSVGGLYAQLALSLEDEFGAGALIVSGAPLSSILARSSLPAVVAQREARMRSLGLHSVADYEAALAEKIHLDVFQQGADGLSKKPLFMIRSSTDTVVPAEMQESLWKVAGSPDGEIYASSHRWSIIRAYLFQRSRIARFFVRSLK